MSLQQRLASWIAQRERLDELHQHRTQLDSIGSLVGRAGLGLRSSLGHVDTDRDAALVYEDCRIYDLRAVWLQRVWDFFRDKFDQRDRADYEAVLRAADQVVWSCHRPPLERAQYVREEAGEVPVPAVAPLPFIESRYALEAFPSSMIPPDLRQDAGFIAEHLSRLPLGLVRLSPSCLGEPWWLVLVAHEVGHNLQADLAPQLEDDFADALREAAAAAATPEDGSWWNRWGSEVFADIVSVLLAGPWAIRALIEIELRTPQEMLARRSRYPPAVIRLELLRRTAERVGLDAQWVVDLLPPELSSPRPETASDLGALDAVLDAALGPLPGVGADLPSLCAVRPGEFAPGGTVERWAEQLADGDDVPKGSGPRAARLMACAALAAWSSGAAGDADGARLARRATEAIAASRDATFRAEEPAPAAARHAGDELAAALLAAGEATLIGEDGR